MTSVIIQMLSMKWR